MQVVNKRGYKYRVRDVMRFTAEGFKDAGENSMSPDETQAAAMASLHPQCLTEASAQAQVSPHVCVSAPKREHYTTTSATSAIGRAQDGL